MTDIEIVKDTITRMQRDGATEDDLRLICEKMFSVQMTWDEYPAQEQIEDTINTVQSQRETIRALFDLQVVNKLQIMADKGCVNAQVLLGQYYYDRPNNELLEDLLISETIDQMLEVSGNTDELARQRVKKNHQKASELFCRAYQRGSILAMYYMAKIWCEGSHERVKPSIIRQTFECRWSQGRLTFEQCGIAKGDLNTIRQALTVCALAEEYVDKTQRQINIVTSEKKRLENLLKKISQMLGNDLHPEAL